MERSADRLGVLIVDDSSIARRLIQSVLEELPLVEILGSAKDGHEAIQRAEELEPDIITLDVEMPLLSGLEALPQLRAKHRDASIIMVSSLTSRGAQQTISALMNGAADYIAKPTQTNSRAEALAMLRRTLLPKLEAICEQQRARRQTRRAGVKLRAVQAAIDLARRPSAATSAVAKLSRTGGLAPGCARETEVLVVGSSTGGPVALATLLSGLPTGFGLPILIAQHMPPTFTRLLAERLASESGLPVREGQTGDLLLPGHAYVAPGDYHMLVRRGAKGHQLVLEHTPPVNSCRPSIDVLLESAAAACRLRVMAVILTGMGADGKHGCAAVRTGGGKIVVQDESTSVVWGMPGAVASAGLADCILPLPSIAPNIVSALGASARSLKPARPAAGGR